MRVGWKQMMTTWEMTLAWLHLSTSRQFAWALCLEHEKQRAGTKTLSFRTLDCHFLDFHHNVSPKANERLGTFHDACVRSGADFGPSCDTDTMAATGWLRHGWRDGPTQVREVKGRIPGRCKVNLRKSHLLNNKKESWGARGVILVW